MRQKVMSLRFSEKLADELAAVARTDDMPISEAVRAAIAGHISTRRTDPEFQNRLKRQLEEDREVLERLASGGEGGPKGN